eukprot:GHVU01029496.1.p1 GENE.GHVU01029496.1~~GHVU01029496.1.p1  ORF type:complete len:160 (-),score=5.98 GHVU01029496.1:2-481(-)
MIFTIFTIFDDRTQRQDASGRSWVVHLEGRRPNSASVSVPACMYTDIYITRAFACVPLSHRVVETGSPRSTPVCEDKLAQPRVCSVVPRRPPQGRRRSIRPPKQTLHSNEPNHGTNECGSGNTGNERHKEETDSERGKWEKQRERGKERQSDAERRRAR